MDYSNDPTPNQHPNQHDYEQLELIYSHLDTTSTFSQSTTAFAGNVDITNPSEWGKEIRKSSDGRTSLFERDLGRGNKVFTFVIWAQ